MSHLQYFDYEGFGQTAKQHFNYSQAVRIDNRIEISGQGGWDRSSEDILESLSEEVDQAFSNVEHALQQAGGKGLDQVYKLRIYITIPLDEIVEHLVRNMQGRFKDHGPLLTVVQVTGLYKNMKLEIEAEAHLG